MKKVLLATIFSTLSSQVWALSAADAPGFLRKLVQIGSDTTELKSVEKCQKLIGDQLKKMGFSVELVPQPLGDVKSAPLLIAERKGNSDRFVTLLMHADTVFPESSGFSGFEEKGDRAVGPGVIDNKGGVVVALRALEKFFADSTAKRSIRVVVSPSEEVGSTGFLETFGKLSLDTDFLLGFEPALENGNIVSSRRGNRWYEISVLGTEAHAGRNHKKGANACEELAIKIEKLRRLTDYSKNITLSIGHIEGGKDKYAIVCGDARAKLDVRFEDLKNREVVIKKIETILNSTFVKSADGQSATKTQFKIVDDPKPFPAEKAAIPLIKKYLATVEGLEGRKIDHEKSGGSADSNFFYRPGLVIIDGLGPVGGNMHRNDEYIYLPSIESRSSAAAELLRAIQ